MILDIFPHLLTFTGEKWDINIDKTHTPPLRLLYFGGDMEFNSFVKSYVEHILGITAIKPTTVKESSQTRLTTTTNRNKTFDAKQQTVR
jgi:hypothetical protein